MDKINVTDFKDYHREIAAEIVDEIGPDIKPREVAKAYPVLWLVVYRSAPLLGDKQIARVVLATRQVCPYCCADSRGCQCWNDE